MAVVLRQLFLATLIDKLRATHGWLGKLKDESSMVGNNVIHLNEIGADPDVLINNTVYPIPTASREDFDVPISLNKYDTTNTRCSVDELYALPYDKPGSIIAQHKGKMEEFIGAHGLYTIAPQIGTTALPILVTTGTAVAGRNPLVEEDLITLGQQWDDAKIPAIGRTLVLSNEHKADLLKSSLGKYIASQIQNITAGGLMTTLFGFDIYHDVYAPVYNRDTMTRKAFGAASASTDARASVAFSSPDCFRALGTAQMFYRDATLSPEERASVAGFQVYGIAAPYTRRSQSAIISGKV